MSNIIIALVGMCGTGKSVVAKYIEEKYHFPCIYFGGFVLEEVKKRNMEINSVNEKNVREDLRAQHGIDVMAKLAESKIDALLQQQSNVLIDGLYSFSEYTYLKGKYGDQLTIIAVHSNKNLRYERLAIRKVRPLTPEQVDDRDYNEIKNIEKAGPIATADYHVVNNGNITQLESQVQTIFTELLPHK
jgi:dephospho-CoA kinase